MEWWAWLLLGILSTSIIVLVLILLLRKPTVIHGLSEEEKNKLTSIERDRVEKELEVERGKVMNLELIAKKQRKQLSKLEEVYNEAKRTINSKKREEFETYLRDANRAGVMLDRLLGIGSEDPTPVRPIPSETDTTGEG